MRILIADDNTLVREGIAQIIGDNGWEVCGQAVNGADALEQTRALRPEILLLDVSMSGTNGIEIANTIKREMPAVKVVIVSHHDLANLPAGTVQADGVVDKARLVADLVATITKILGQGSLAATLRKPPEDKEKHAHCRESEEKLSAHETLIRADSAIGQPAKTVLVVDDNALIRQELREEFTVNGFTVCAEADNGRVAIEQARGKRPRLIVLDLSMPVMNGLACAPELRKILPDTPIILYTAYADALSSIDVSANGVTRIFAKSEPLPALIALADKLVRA